MQSIRVIRMGFELGRVMISTGLPVGNNFPVRAPPGERKSNVMREAVPGTPSIEKLLLSARWAFPSLTGKVALIVLDVFVLKRESVIELLPDGTLLTRPACKANGAIPLERFPQFPI